MTFTYSMQRLTARFLITAAILILTALISYIAVHRLLQNQQKLILVNNIADEIEQVVSLAKDAETGERGYVITGKEEYLEPYIAGSKNIPKHLNYLESLLRDPNQLKQFATLKQLILSKLAHTQQIINVRKQDGFLAAQELVNRNLGKSIMDSARKAAHEMLSANYQALQQNLITSKRSSQEAIASTAIMGVLSLLLLILLYQGIQRDNLTRQQAAEEIKNNERKLRAIVDNSESIIFLKSKDGKYALVNSAFEELFQMRRNKVEGKTDRELFPSPLSDALRKEDEKVLQDGKAHRLEEELVLAHQTRTYLFVKFPLNNEQLIPYALGCIATDITDLKEKENEIRHLNETLEQKIDERTKDLQETNQQLEAFSYTVSHDLRAPLRGIQGFSEALIEDYAEALDQEAREYLKRIVRGAGRMEQLIEDLLSYSRLSRQQMSLTSVDLQQPITEVLEQLSSEIVASGVQILIQEPLGKVQAHYGTLKQIFQNLISNSLKFIPPGVSPRIVIRSELQEDKRIRTWVEDNGIGIKEEHHQRIFQVFERLHGNEAYPGTGIGLAIVKKGIERMGGLYGVESRAGSGSKFWIELRCG